MIPKYTHILFDADNTLFDFDPVELYAIKTTFDELGLPFSDETMKVYAPYNEGLWQQFEEGKIEKSFLLTHRFQWLGEQVGLPIDGAEFNVIYNGHLMERYALMPGAEEVCRTLSQHTTMVVTTNGNSDMQNHRFNSAVEINKYFKGLFISDELNCAKPSVEFYNKVFDAMGIEDKSKVLMVGDSVAADMVGANNAGIDCCWFNPKHQTQDKARITYEIDHLTQLIPIVLGEDDSHKEE